MSGKSNHSPYLQHTLNLCPLSRQLLAHQPNRMYVQCLLLSEETCRLVHFDRSGAQVSPRFNIHTQSLEFVRLVVALTSPNEAAIGFDDSIKWKIDPDSGRKVSGTLTYKLGPNKADKKIYSLMDVEPIATHVIRGRATTCWSVEDPKTGERFVVKDSWTSAGRTPEHELLMKANESNLPGICEYVSHQTGRGQTKDFRCKISVQGPLFRNRVASRILMKAYGKPVQHFKTVLQLLSALYDAISGKRYCVPCDTLCIDTVLPLQVI